MDADASAAGDKAYYVISGNRIAAMSKTNKTVVYAFYYYTLVRHTAAFGFGLLGQLFPLSYIFKTFLFAQFALDSEPVFTQP